MKYRKKRVWIWSCFFLGILFLGWMPQRTVFAAAPSFIAQIVQSTSDDTQKNKPYFELTLEPNQTQTVQIMVQNNLDRKNKIRVTPTIAATSDSGHAVYKDSKIKRDPTLKYAFPTLTGKPQTVELRRRESKTLTFEIKAPAEPFPGLIMGGFAVESLTAGSVKSSQSSKVDKHVQIGYGIATILHSAPTVNTVVAPKLAVSDPGLSSYNSQPELTINVHNTQPNYLTQMTMTAKIYQNDNQEPLITDKQTNLSMAANSNFDLSIPWKTKSIVAGKYRLLLEFKAGGQTWKFDQRFLVTQNKATYLNKHNAKIKPNYKPWIIMTTILLVVLIVSFSWILYYKGQQRGKRGKNRRRR